MIENKMVLMGYNKLQEKDNCIYYEKNVDNQHIYLIVDKKKNKIKSFDAYEIDGEKFRSLQVDEIKDKKICQMFG